MTKSKHLELFGILMCMEIVLAFSYLGYIQISILSVTTLHILVIVAAMLFGPLDADMRQPDILEDLVRIFPKFPFLL